MVFIAAIVVALVLLVLYSVMLFAVFLGRRVERLNPLATGDPEILRGVVGRVPRVLVVLASYNEEHVLRVLPAWLRQNYPDYLVVVAEDGRTRFDGVGRFIGEKEYSHTVNGRRVEGVVEKYWCGDNVFLVVRRRRRDGYKAGALNNTVYLADTGLLGELAGKPGWRPDYVVVVDADQRPGGNPLAKLVDPRKLVELEEIGRKLLGYRRYRLDLEKISDPETFVTRLVELIEYHRRFVPELAVVQVHQSHPSSGSPVAPYTHASYELSLWANILRSPRIELVPDNGNVYGELVVDKGVMGRVYGLFRDFAYKVRRERLVDGVRVRVSRHFFPSFMGSAAIIAFDVVKRYWFADGVFTRHTSVTEDFDFTSRITLDGYLVVASQQAETIAAPPDSYRSLVDQYYRWAKGTFTDFTRYVRRVFSSRKLSWTGKLGYVSQLLFYVDALFPAAMVAMLLLVSPPIALTVFTYMLGLSLASDIIVARKHWAHIVLAGITTRYAGLKALADTLLRRNHVERRVTRKATVETTA